MALLVRCLQRRALQPHFFLQRVGLFLRRLFSTLNAIVLRFLDETPGSPHIVYSARHKACDVA